MDLTHDFTVPASLEEAWAAFNHLELVAACFPGVALTSVDGQDFSGVLKVKLGPTTLLYNGTGRYVERQLGGRRVVLDAAGSDHRGKGDIKAKVKVSLTTAGPRTAVHLATDLSLTGDPARLAPEVLQDAADRLFAQFAEALAEEFGRGLGAEALAVDRNPSFASALGRAASSTSQAAAADGRRDETDYDKFRRLAPVVLTRVVPAAGAGAVLLWVVRRLSRH
jgi:carbon monoxide dehydrogenase subunit G